MRKIRAWFLNRAAEAAGAKIPGWWDFDVDCGFSDRWYRCGTCLACKEQHNA